MRVRSAIFLIGLAIPTFVHADEESLTNGFVSKWIEMPAHRALTEELAVYPIEPTPFTTDGCSGGMSGMWHIAARKLPDLAAAVGQHPPWENCCVAHDRAYHNIAGALLAEDSFDSRLMADTSLRSCVNRSADLNAERLAAKNDVTIEFVRAVFAQTANAMFASVRIGGGPCTALPWRWGYGYPNCIVSFHDLGLE